MSVRLNKLLAQRGIASRRKCDALIQSGVIRVNGKVVTELGVKVEPERDRVTVRGRPLPGPGSFRYYALNKPVGVITTMSDPEGRRTIAEFLPRGPRLFTVGRLDADTSGLLIATNDGEFAHHLMHPRYGVEKGYRVRVDRAPSPAALSRLKSGVKFGPGRVSGPARVRVMKTDPDEVIVEIGIREGRHRQVRLMFEALGLEVKALHRFAFGPLRLKGLERGMYRELSADEVQRLRQASARPQRTSRTGHMTRGRGPKPTAPRAGPPRRAARSRDRSA